MGPSGAHFHEVAEVVAMWAARNNPGVSRRDVLARLSTAFAVAAAVPLVDLTDADEQTRVARVLDEPHRLDAATLDHAEAILLRCRQQGDVVGPQVALQTALAQRHAVGRIASTAPSRLRNRALSIHAELTQLVGWLLFNLGDYRRAQHYYDEARSTAHDAENVELVTYVLCTMSHLATWQGKPRVGIDHAIAAAAWAEQAGSPHARAYAADVAVRAFIADGQRDKGKAALAKERAAVGDLTHEGASPSAPWWYFYDKSFYWGTVSEYALEFNRAEDAHRAIDRSLALVDQTNLHNYAFQLLVRGEAFLRQEEIAESTRVIGDVASLTAVHASGRLDQRIDGLRHRLSRWATTRSVRELDERLATYRRR